MAWKLVRVQSALLRAGTFLLSQYHKLVPISAGESPASRRIELLLYVFLRRI